MKKNLCFVLTALLLILSAVPFSVNAAQSSNRFIGTDHSGAYIVSFSGKSATVTRYSSGYVSYDLQLKYNVNKACAFDGKVVLFCNDSQNNQLVVYVYYMNNDVLDSFSIYGAYLYGNTEVCCDNDCIYIVNHNNLKELKRFSYTGNRLKSYSFNDVISYTVSAYDAGVYVISDDQLYHIDGDSCTTISGASVKGPLFPADHEYFATAFGKIYFLNGNTIESAFDVDYNGQACSSCVIGNCIYYPNGSVINGYDLYSGQKVCYYNNAFDASLIYAEGDSVTAVNTQSGSSFKIYRDSFTEIRTNGNNQAENNSSGGSGSGNRSNGSNGSGSQSGSANASRSGISSDVYKIDFNNYYISGISSGTTVAAFRSNIRYDGYSLSVYRNSSIKKSGSVGTGMTAVFEANNGDTVNFELSVVGDLSGEGNENSRDLNILLDHLIGEASFNGVYTLSADLSGDGSVDLVDAVMMKREI